jgi:hypothetical protein
LANLVSYTAKRNTAAEGYLKVFNVTTTENVVDYNGVNLANITVNWADPNQCGLARTVHSHHQCQPG